MYKPCKLIISLSLMLVSIHAFSQIQWPVITQTCKPWTRWWWQGNAVNKKDLSIVMKQYQAAGLGGLELTPIYGVAGHEKEFIDYLSPKWMDNFEYTLREAKRLGLGLDMSTGTGWPFGGGPLVTPDIACRDLEFKVFKLKGGERLTDSVIFNQQPYIHITGNQVYKLDQIYKGNDEETKKLVETLRASGKTPGFDQLKYPIYANPNLQAISFDQVKYPIRLPLLTLRAYSPEYSDLDLTNKVDAQGKLDWTAPTGDWTLYALFLGWHGKIVERAAPGAEGDVIDHFSSRALKKYLSRFDTAFAGHDIFSLRAFFNDSYEVDDARGQSNWTADFFDDFIRLRGYELRGYLNYLLTNDTSERHLRILRDYRQTISDLLLENFTNNWHYWAFTKNAIIRNQAHGSPANILDLYGASDIPETEGTDVLRYKFATSAAHVTGKPLASAETVTWLNEHFLSSLGDVKQAIDKYFVGGVNHVFYHGLAYSPPNEPWPGWMFYAAVHFTPDMPSWPHFSALNNYIAHCQSFLQKGRSNNDVLLYFPFNDRISQPGTMLFHFDGLEGFENSGLRTAAEFLQNNGYAFDLISDKQILGARANGNVIFAGRDNYRTLLVPDVKYIPRETMEKLMQMANEGAEILFYKNFPSRVPGYSHYEEKENALKKMFAALKFTRNSNVQKARYGQGTVLWSDDLNELMISAGAREEHMVQSGLQFCRRKYEDGTIYFIVNKSNAAINDWIILQTTANYAVLFDPMYERSGLAKIAKVAGDTSMKIMLQLKPGESCIVQTSSKPITGNPFPYYRVTGASKAIDGKWDIKFISGGPTLPAPAVISQTGSWTDLPEEGVKQFSGIAAYTIHFPKPSAADAQAWLLDLGKVAESAEIILNGKKLAVLIDSICQVLIPLADLKSENVLEIQVANSMANRIADMDKQGIQWKKFYNTDFPARFPADRGPDGLFTASKWEPRPSGLLGPVTITPVAFIK